MSQPIREKAIIALLTEPSIAKAAASIGVNEKTLRRWKQDQEFQNQLEATRREIYLASLAKLHARQEEVIEKAFALLHNSRSEVVQAFMVRFLAEHGVKTYETFDLAQRIAALEALTKEQNQ